MSSDSDLAVETSGLVKIFGGKRAVDGVDLAIRPGSVYGFLGPNGAGKTTTIKMLATLLRPDDGTAKIFGHDVVRQASQVRSRISLTGQFSSVDEGLNGTENLVLVGRLLGYSWPRAKERAAQLMEAFGLAEAAGRMAKTYSGGMRRRLDIAASIVVTPDLLFLDEPTTGLDPRSRSQVWDIVRALVAEGTTVLLTTQYLEEADALSDRIAVIDNGKVIAEGTPGELKSSVGSGALYVRVNTADERPLAERVLAETLNDSVFLEPEPTALSARVTDPELVARSMTELHRSGIEVTNFSLGQPSMNEVFLALTGKPPESVDPAETKTADADDAEKETAA